MKKQKTNQIIKKQLGVIVLLFSLSSILLSCGEKQVLPNLYTNSEKGFSFEYPDGYQRTGGDGAVIRLYFKRQGFREAKLPEISASVFEKEAAPNLDTAAENYLKLMKTIPEGSQFKIERKERVKLSGGTQALRFKIFWVYTYPDNPEYQYEMITSVIVAFNKKKGHWVTLTMVDWTGGDSTPKDISDVLLSLKMIK